MWQYLFVGAEFDRYSVKDQFGDYVPCDGLLARSPLGNDIGQSLYGGNVCSASVDFDPLPVPGNYVLWHPNYCADFETCIAEGKTAVMKIYDWGHNSSQYQYSVTETIPRNFIDRVDEILSTNLSGIIMIGIFLTLIFFTTKIIKRTI